MPTVLVSHSTAPVAEAELSVSDNDRIGFGGGPGGPGHDPQRVSQIEPEPQGTPFSAYRLFTFLAIVWVAALFVTLALVLESRWVHSSDWISIPVPHILYLNTAILLSSSLAMEFARLSLRRDKRTKGVRWILVTMLLGLMFLSGQIVAWQELNFRGLHLASNPGSFFFYVITGTHGIHILVGIALLASVSFSINRFAKKTKQRAAVGAIALYWHFMNALWVSLLGLFLITLQR